MKTEQGVPEIREMLQRRRQGHRLPGTTKEVQKRGLKVQGLTVRGLKIQLYQEEEEGDYEDEDYDDNLSQENLREMYIAAVDLAIHRVSTQGADHLPPSSTCSEDVAKTGRNHLNEEFTPLLPTGIGEIF